MLKVISMLQKETYLKKIRSCIPILHRYIDTTIDGFKFVRCFDCRAAAPPDVRSCWLEH